nr:hypothetical protein [Corynebacterium diphtheriae]
MIKHQKEHHCSRWASTVAVSKEVGVSPNSIWNWFKKGALEAEEVHEFGECPIVCVRGGLGLQVVRESVGVSHG